MAAVKWIKIVTDIFDDEKMLLIESLPAADSIIVVWFKLLCLAGKNNNSGVFIFNDRIPYTNEMLATIFRRDINTVRLALKTFEEFGMIEVIDNVITIPNWDKHQSLDAYERRKEQDRIRKRRKKEEQKALVASISADSSAERSVEYSAEQSADFHILEEDREEDKEENRDIEVDPPDDKRPATPDHIYTLSDEVYVYENDSDGKSKRPVRYETIKNLYNDTCVSLSKCTVMSEARKKAIKARFTSGYTLDDFKHLFEKTEASNFLKGANSRNWRATFDWLIKDGNMAKVLDGNYDDHGRGSGTTPTPPRQDDLDFIPD
ncbi:MAG: phage replisome organizer N-terminal domain-containing protein [Butyricicoccus pullicaecorum]|nr:phage replisome organizer N-terminal domain-containing protein [Butyricicoccus pullicaecorum]